ncbi:glycosyltransferase family 10 domain-containing protein [Polynucleobacter sp.]|jgi:hypothetical protein|uniref:glycosyltransferase family 10 domain-containing protein n=1 Tax=Polynucleobacter sp. TaxID=2029855 RepID=UPI0037C7B446
MHPLQWLRYRLAKLVYRRKARQSDARINAFNQQILQTHSYQSASKKTVYIDDLDLHWFFTSNLSSTRNFLIVKRPEDAQYIFFITVMRDLGAIQGKKVFLLFQEPEDYSNLYRCNFSEKFFLDNEVTVVSHFKNADFILKNSRHQYLRAYAGYRNYHGASIEVLQRLDQRDRSKEIFSITSGLKGIAGNVKRKQFIEVLASSNPNFDYFGRFNKDSFSLKNYKGLCDFKFELLGSYKYNLVIENSPVEDWYISEKIFDALICGCFPIYHGTSKIFEVLPKEWFYYLPSLEVSELNKLNAFLKTNAYKVVAENRNEIASYIDHKFGFYSAIEDIVNGKNLQCTIYSTPEGKEYIKR